MVANRTDQSGDCPRAVPEPAHRRDACQQHPDEAERPIPGGRCPPRQRARALDSTCRLKSLADQQPT
jgi:hypothetical protein